MPHRLKKQQTNFWLEKPLSHKALLLNWLPGSNVLVLFVHSFPALNTVHNQKPDTDLKRPPG